MKIVSASGDANQYYKCKKTNDSHEQQHMNRGKARTSRIIVLLLSLIMVLTTVVPYAFAAGEGTGTGSAVSTDQSGQQGQSDQGNQKDGTEGTDGAAGGPESGANAVGDAGDGAGTDGVAAVKGGVGANDNGDAEDGAGAVDDATPEDGTDAAGTADDALLGNAAKGATGLRGNADGDDADGDSSVDVPFSIPRVLITIKKGKGKNNPDIGQAAIDAMNNSENHSYKSTGTMDIRVPEGFSYVDFGSGAVLSDQTNIKLDYMRGRGNTTWNSGFKKPYKIKLDNEQSLLGMDANDSWALLANEFDPSLSRNRVTYWLGRTLGMEFTPQACPVDLFVGGDNDGDGVADDYTYYGSYVLSHIPKDKYDIPGGYLMSIEQDPGSEAVFYTRKGAELQNIEPSFDPEDGEVDETQKAYIRNYVQEAEDALFEGETANASDPSGYRQLDYRDYFDLDAAALYWLIQEFSNNGDRYETGSTYFYKNSDDQGGKIYWGPLWDFDFAWDYCGYDDYETIGTGMEWMVALLYDKSEGSMYDLIKKDWPVLKGHLLQVASEEDNGLLNEYYEEMKLSQAADYAINKDKNPDRKPAEDYEEAIDELRKWIIARVAWMDSHLSELDNFSHKIVLKDDPDDMHPQVFYAVDDRFFVEEAEEPDKPGKVFLGWYVEDKNDPNYGESIYSISNIDRDITATARYVDEKKASKTKEIYFLKDVAGVRLSDKTFNMPYTLVPEDAQDKRIKWESSDKSIAVVDKKGEVTLLKTGEVTITASMSDGLSKSYRLIISDRSIDPTDVKLSHKIIYMRPGDMRHLGHTVTPENATSDDFFESEDYEIAEVEPSGMIKAKAPGRTKVVLSVYGSDSISVSTRIDRECIVIVSDKAGKITTTTETKGVSGKATNLADVADAVLTSEDKRDQYCGADVKLWLKMVALDENNVATSDKKLFLDYMDSNGMAVGKYLDISLFKKIGEFATEEVHESSVPVKFRVKIPKELRLTGKKAAGKVRTFYLLRVHDGKVDCVAKGTGDTLECSSSLFSTYLLAYEDNKAGAHSKSVNTGDENTLYLWAGIMAASMLLCLVMLAIKRRRLKRSR